MSRSITLVVGATGLVGRDVCERLVRLGRPVRALVRSDEAERLLRSVGCDTARGDLRDASSLRLACAEAATVVTTATAVASRQPGNSIAEADRRGALALVAAARAEGVGHFIYTSISPRLPATNPFVSIKREVEAAVRQSGMAYTILQPTAFMEIHTGPLAGWDLAAGRARIVGSGRAPISYISATDVAAFAAAAVGNTRAAGRDLHLAGPEPLSARDAIAIAEQVTTRQFRVQRAPAGALALASRLLRPFNPSLSSLLDMASAMDSGMTVDMTPLLREFAIEPTTFLSYVRRVLAGHSLLEPA